MKKLLACLLAALLLMSACAAFAEEGAGTDGTVTIFAFDPVEDPVGIQEGTQLIVGNTTELSGDFGMDQFGINTADVDVRGLLHGYSTVAWTRTLGLAMNGTCVQRVEATTAANNDRTYTIELTPGLMYNDGTLITAKDYVFSYLLSGSPEMQKIGASQKTERDKILGFSEYTAGESSALSGVRLLSDSSFSVTIKAEYLPYFYGLEMLNVTPYPISVIAPGCDVFDDGQGAYIGAAANAAGTQAAGFVPGQFSVEMLQKTILDPETGYLYNPRVTSGPYFLDSFDKETHVATFVINPNYVGNYEGQKPHIERLVFQTVNNDTMIAEMESGKVNLLNKVSSLTPVSAGLMMSDITGSINSANYPRTGFSFLAFACEEGPTSSAAVRKAVAYCVDKQAVVESFVGATNGIPVYGYYGLGQWMINQNFQENTENNLDALSVQEELQNLYMQKDLAAAERLLADDGWTLNKDGQPFVKGTDDIRYRDNQGQLEALMIRWAWPAENSTGDFLEKEISASFEELGIGLEVQALSFEELLKHYYRQTERTYNMFFLATNFDYIFDPYLDFNTADAYQGSTNKTGIRDEELMNRAWAMRSTPSADMRAYVENWLDFQYRFVDVMPMVPLYSNVYFDFYPKDLQGYNIAEHASWALAIPYAYISDEPILPDLIPVDFGEATTEAPAANP